MISPSAVISILSVSAIISPSRFIPKPFCVAIILILPAFMPPRAETSTASSVLTLLFDDTAWFFQSYLSLPESILKSLFDKIFPEIFIAFETRSAGLEL